MYFFNDWLTYFAIVFFNYLHNHNLKSKHTSLNNEASVFIKLDFDLKIYYDQITDDTLPTLCLSNDYTINENVAIRFRNMCKKTLCFTATIFATKSKQLAFAYITVCFKYSGTFYFSL